ncbi:tyrosine-type recombinase/integrase [Rhizorhabdus histidinilytica]|uniref:tyrosine-type recombinase/integrase n=1 Tax=Rhizorhabdus histidinilytica TaxID=439228 RepID=UPI00321F933E
MLNDAKVKAAKPKDKAYRLGDSGQLYLQVEPSGGRHWRMNYTFGRSKKDPTKPAQKTLSFGSYPAVTLNDARKARDKAKALLAAGRDPAIEKRVEVRAQIAESENTFRALAERWFELKSGWSLAKLRDWRSKHDGKWDIRDAGHWTVRKGGWAPKHSKKVWESMVKDVLVEIGDLPINSIDAPRLLELLAAVEKRDAIETAHRLRQRISAVFVYGIAAGVARVDPAASLNKALTPKPRTKPQPSIVDHARDQEERIRLVRQLMIDCEAKRTRVITKLALRFLALSAVRSNELQLARWTEIEGLNLGGGPMDSPNALWRIPAERMKGDDDRKNELGGDHLVPLPWQAVAVLLVLHELTGDLDLMFPSERHVHRPISENTIRSLLIDVGYGGRHVPHGFRAAFSTIMNERAVEQRIEGDRKIIDLMLAHVPKDKVEKAYNRADFLPRRREIAQEYADILLGDFWPPEIFVGQPMRVSIGNPGNRGNWLNSAQRAERRAMLDQL